MRDLIERQAAINLLKKWSDGYQYIETETELAIKEFQELPAAQHEIIRCKDCVHYYVGYPYDCCSLTDKCAEENDFCSWAERPRRWNK